MTASTKRTVGLGRIAAWLFVIAALVPVSAARAQPIVEVYLSVSVARDGNLYQGWPLFIEATLMHRDAMQDGAVPVSVLPLEGSWARRLELSILNAQGQPADLSLQLMDPPDGPLVVDGATAGVAAWWAPAGETGSIAPGSYEVRVQLDAAAIDASAIDVDPPTDAPAISRFRFEVAAAPAPLSPDLQAQRALKLAELELILGDADAALAIVSDLLEDQPNHEAALFAQGEILRNTGRTWEAMTPYIHALEQYQGATTDVDATTDLDATNLDATTDLDEPPMMLLSALRSVRQEILNAVAFEVTFEPKSDGHPYSGIGSSSGYAIDGISGRELYLAPGVTYTFRMDDVPAEQAFYLSTSPVGGGAAPYDAGVTGAPAGGTTEVVFTPGPDTPDVLYYQSMQETHAGWKIRILNSEIIVALEHPPSEALPRGVSLSPLYPNPFSPSARLNLTLDEAQHVRIVVHDLLGRAVRVLHEGELQRGVVHTFEFDGSGLPSGLYLIRVTGERFESTRSAMLLR